MRALRGRHRCRCRVAALLLSVASAVAAAEPIPPLAGETLSGEPFALPGDLHARPALLVVTFAKAARHAAEDWRRRLDGTFPAGHPTVLSIAVLEPMPAFVRSLVVAGIRRGTPAPLHDRFLVVGADDDSWWERFGRPGDERAAVVLLDRDGAIAWSTSEPVDEHRLGELEATLESLTAADEGPPSAGDPGGRGAR
jgi:hypothetical protein